MNAAVVEARLDTFDRDQLALSVGMDQLDREDAAKALLNAASAGKRVMPVNGTWWRGNKGDASMSR